MTVPREFCANRAWRMRALEDGAKVPGAAQAYRAACAADILVYANLFCWTMDPRRRQSVVPFITYPFQDAALVQLVKAVEEGRDVGIKKSRDMGASWLNLLAATWFWQFRPMQQILLVSRNENYVDGNADSLFWKIDFLLAHQPDWLKPHDVKRTAMHLGNLDNGSAIDGESTTGEVGRGGRRTFILLDEFAAFDVKSGFNALSATQAVTDCRIFNSTPKGDANAFAQVFKKGSVEEITLHWSQHPRKNPGLYTSEKDADGRMVLKRLDDWAGPVTVRGKCERGQKTVRFPDEYPFVLDGKVRSPWYDRECARAVTQVEIAQELDIDFQGSDYAFFDPTALDRYEELYCREPEIVGELEFDRDVLEPVRFASDAKGCMALWCVLGRDGRPDPEKRFVIGADVAAGTGASNSTLAVYEEGTNEKVAEWANPRTLPADFARRAVAVARFFNAARIVPDRSGPTGEVFVRTMLDAGYGRIYMRRNEKKATREVVEEYGVWLNPSARTAALENYRDAIGNAKLVNRSARAIGECRQFIRKMDGSVEHSASAYANDPTAARAAHGDLVIADALALMGLVDAAKNPHTEGPEVPVNSIAGRMAEAARRERAARHGELEGGW